MAVLPSYSHRNTNTEADTRRNRVVAVKNLTLSLFVRNVEEFGTLDTKYSKRSLIFCSSRSLECKSWRPGSEVSEGNKDFMSNLTEGRLHNPLGNNLFVFSSPKNLHEVKREAMGQFLWWKKF